MFISMCRFQKCFLPFFSINFQGQGQRSKVTAKAYNINNYDQDNVFEKYKTSVIDSKHILTIFDVTFK